MEIRKYILLSFCFFYFSLLTAQIDSIDIEQIDIVENKKIKGKNSGPWYKENPMRKLPMMDDAPPARWAIKYSLMSLIDFVNPSVQMAVEYRFAERWSVQMEAGYIFPSEASLYHQQGWRMRPEVRYYYGKKEKKMAIALEAMYRYLYIWAQKDFFRHDRAYIESIDYVREKHNTAFHTKFYGFTSFGKNKRYFLEGGVGIGLRSLYILEAALPSDAEPVPTMDLNLFHTRPANTLIFLPSMTCMMKLGMWL